MPSAPSMALLRQNSHIPEASPAAQFPQNFSRLSRSASLNSSRLNCYCSHSSTMTAKATSTSAAGLQQLSKPSTAPVHCPSKPPAFEGDFNAHMLFNRGLHTVKAVDKDTFWPAVEAAGDKLVVVDLYSKWCGPCRLIYPKLVKLSDEYEDVVFLKVDCSKDNDNKFLFSKMGIGILPTFKIFKNSNLVSEVKGAKYDELVRQIEKNRVCDE